MALTRPSVSRNGTAGTSASADLGAWSKSLATLAEFLSPGQFADGTSREGGTLLLFQDGNMWKACLHDRTAGASGFVSASTPEGLLKACDAALAGNSVDWRADRKPSQSKR